MQKENVGAGILSIITESLYDKPIVVFREYIQNSIDAFDKVSKVEDNHELYCKSWINNNNLYFLDNGTGIKQELFRNKMETIAFSEKNKIKNVGYKGIGRLSGLPYCDKLVFINILDYKNSVFQKYTINNKKYRKMKYDLNNYDYTKLIEIISEYKEEVKNNNEIKEIEKIINKNEIFHKRNTGFLVMLKNINTVLKNTIIKSNNLLEELGWLLPVRFKEELFKKEYEYLFKELNEPYNDTKVIPTKSYNISFNNKVIERPLEYNMLRDYVMKKDFKYAIGFYTFNRDKIVIKRGNSFSGIRLYLNNIFLCDESEIIPLLQRYGLINYTENELIQSIRAIGAMIYITDKISISANARRTFIEITDSDSLDFLQYIAKFIEEIYKARYALSKYRRLQNNISTSEKELEKAKITATEALQKLAEERILIDPPMSDMLNFQDLEEIDKKRIVKRKLAKIMNNRIKDYISQTDSFDYDNIGSNFITWLTNNE